MKRRGCLLGRTPGGDEKCPPGACRTCGWEAANAERRRARVRRWDMARAFYTVQEPGCERRTRLWYQNIGAEREEAARDAGSVAGVAGELGRVPGADRKTV